MRITYDINKEIKKQLENFNAIKKRRDIILNSIEELESFTSVHSAKMDTIQVANVSSGKDNIYNRNLVKRDQLKEELVEINYMIDNMSLALDQVKKDSNRELYKLIELRYFQNKHVNDILPILMIEKSTFYRWEKEAFDIIRIFMPS